MDKPVINITEVSGKNDRITHNIDVILGEATVRFGIASNDFSKHALYPRVEIIRGEKTAAYYSFIVLEPKEYDLIETAREAALQHCRANIQHDMFIFAFAASLNKRSAAAAPSM